MSAPDRILPANITQTIKGNLLPVLLFAVGVAVTVFLFMQSIFSADVYILAPKDGAEWIRYPEPVNLHSWEPAKMHRFFRKRFTVSATPDSAFLEVWAFRDALVSLDGNVILPPTKDYRKWKDARHVDLSPYLQPGEHEIRILVQNEKGHSAVLAYCKEIGLRTGPDWEAGMDGVKWSAALPVDEITPVPLARMFPRTDKALWSRTPYLLPIFILVFSLTFWWYGQREHPAALERIVPDAGKIRWFLIVALSILGANNIMKFPLINGFDVVGHTEYIRYIAEKFRLPLANEGWVMFHPPLYYIISAPIYLVCSKLFATGVAEKMLRVIPIACGVIQIELAYRALKQVFPDRGDLQTMGTIIAGLIPINIYNSQVVGNEVFSGCFVSLALVMCFSLIRLGAQGPRWRLPLLGLALGLGMLSKMTAIMMIPPVMIMLAAIRYNGAGKIIGPARAAGVVFGVALAVSAWYYIRNAVLLGASNIGDWNVNIYLQYWQDPGYRSVGQFWRFGEALAWPIFSGTQGLWDGIYSTFWMDGFLSSADRYDVRPPWNYNFMLSGILLAIPLSLGIIAGIGRALTRPLESARGGALFSVLVVGVYFAGFLYHFIQVPFYSGVKFTYMEGILPCYAVLAVYGLDLIMRRKVWRSVVCGLLACWATATYLAYFIH